MRIRPPTMKESALWGVSAALAYWAYMLTSMVIRKILELIVAIF